MFVIFKLKAGVIKNSPNRYSFGCWDWFWLNPEFMWQKLWKAWTGPFFPLETLSEIFPGVSDLPAVLPSRTFNTWSSPRRCLPLIELWRPPVVLMPHLRPSLSNTLPPPLLSLPHIWCNYLIIPAFVTHRAFSPASPMPSCPLILHISLSYISVSPLWRSQFNSG